MISDRVKLAVAVISTVGCVASVVIGRVSTFHMTEGEAFINGMPFWFISVCFAISVMLITRKL